MENIENNQLSKKERRAMRLAERQQQRAVEGKQVKLKKTFRLFGIIAAVIVGVGLIGFFATRPAQPGELDDFTQCLTDQGAIFYGAFWCPHCQDQKKIFGNSERLLPYVECSTPSGGGQTAECSDAGVEGYPTWEFADGSRQSGVMSLSQLAEKTGCQLPE